MFHPEDCFSVISLLAHLNAEIPFKYGTNTESRGFDSSKDFFL
jgi:hypothetical protein